MEESTGERKLTEDYAAAKKAVGALWQSLTKEAHSKFSSIADQVEKRYERCLSGGNWGQKTGYDN